MSFREMVRAVKRPPRPDTGSDFGDKAADYAISAGQALLEPPLKALAAFGDYWTRPQVATSEAYGEYEEGGDVGDVVAAGWKGFTEGYKKAEHPLWEERLVPHEEGEGIGRKALRMGAGALTDPLIVAGGPIFKAAGKAGVVGARAAKTIATKTPVVGPKLQAAGTALREHQGLARATRSLSKLPEMFGGRAGKVVSKRMDRALNNTELQTGRAHVKDMEIAKGLGIAGDEARLRQATKVMEGKAPRGRDDAVDAWADYLREQYDNDGFMLESYQDRFGEGFKIWDDQAEELVPFQMLRDGDGNLIDYVPQTLRADIDVMRGVKSSARAKKLARDFGISEEKARKMLREHKVEAPRAGHIEMARHGEIPEGMREMNSLVLRQKYVDQVYKRMFMSDEFGVDYRGLEQLLKWSGGNVEGAGRGAKARTGLGNLSDDIQNDILKVAKGVHTKSWIGADDLINKILSFQVLSKLGPTTTIMNTGQKLNDYVRSGLAPFAKGLRRSINNEEKMLYATSYVGAIRNYMEQVAGTTGGRGLMERASGAWLRGVGFTGTEEINRVGASIAGVERAKSLTRQLVKDPTSKKIWDELQARGLVRRDIDDFVRTGDFARGRKQAIGLLESNKTQHATNIWELPPIWQSPEARVFLQFKRFAFNQAKFLHRDVAKPAWKWMDTGGKQGDIGPLLRAMVAYTGGGMTIATAREALRDMQTWALGAKKRKTYRDYDEHPIGQMLKDMTYVGSFGIAGDVFEMLSRGQGEGWILGPTASDAVDVLERTAQATKAMAIDDETPTLESLFTAAYRYSGRGALGVTPSQLSSVGSRGLPRAARNAFKEMVSQ